MQREAVTAVRGRHRSTRPKHAPADGATDSRADYLKTLDRANSPSSVFVAQASTYDDFHGPRPLRSPRTDAVVAPSDSSPGPVRARQKEGTNVQF